ncbi:MAG TPA: hypothetical protein VEB41_04045 [Burkholderiales bacterium]|nr:hypothetical protein [Burkholderiales bacterium]
MNEAKSKGAGSPTNASDAVDDVRLPSKPTTDQKMDAGVKETFPASDPVSISQPRNTEHERNARGEPSASQPPPAPKRSPDWLLDKDR